MFLNYICFYVSYVAILDFSSFSRLGYFAYMYWSSIEKHGIRFGKQMKVFVLVNFEVGAVLLTEKKLVS